MPVLSGGGARRSFFLDDVARSFEVNVVDIYGSGDAGALHAQDVEELEDEDAQLCGGCAAPSRYATTCRHDARIDTVGADGPWHPVRRQGKPQDRERVAFGVG